MFSNGLSDGLEIKSFILVLAQYMRGILENFWIKYVNYHISKPFFQNLYYTLYEWY